MYLSRKKTVCISNTTDKWTNCSTTSTSALPIMKLSNFKSNISSIQEGSPQSLYREREKLVRAADAMKNELQTYENNLGFLTASSKKGNSLLTELNRKVEKLKADIELVKQKIKVIDDSIRSAE